jgi:hypothetical protein
MVIKLAMDLPPCLTFNGMTPAIRLQAFHLLMIWEIVMRIVEMIRAGTYRPGQPRKPSEEPRAERAAAAAQKPLRPCGGKFISLLPQPEMSSTIAQAPEALGRPVRPLCWAVGVKAPAIISPPKRPRKPRPETARPETEQPLEWHSNGRLSPQMRARLPDAAPLIYRAGMKGVRRPNGTRRSPPKMAWKKPAPWHGHFVPVLKRYQPCPS